MDLKTTLESRLGNVLKNTGHGIKKYELTGDTLRLWLGTLYRIRALISFKTIDGDMVKKGDLGGWVMSEDNLSQEGLCWVADEAKVLNNAKVYDNALVKDYAEVSGYAKIYGNAKMYNYTQAYGKAEVHDDAVMHDNAQACERVEVCKKAWLCGSTQVYSGIVTK